MKKIKAVTLIELLIASSIFVVLMLSIYSAFHTGIFGYRNIEEAINISQGARQILERINLDLRDSFAYAKDQTKFTGNKNDISFLALIDTFNENKIMQDYAFVSYALKGDKLMWLCRKNKDSLNDKSEVQPEELSANIKEIIFSYGNIVTAGQPLQWKDSWASQGDPEEEQKVLPLAVKVKLTLKNRAEQDFERTIFLPRTS